MWLEDKIWNFRDHQCYYETNCYASDFIESNKDKLDSLLQSQVHKWTPFTHKWTPFTHKWTPFTVAEFRAFLAVVLNMGLNQKPNYNAYWDTCHHSQETPWFPAHFNRDRFQIILKFLHFADNSQMPERDEPDYKLYKIKEIVDYFNQKCIYHYHPFQNISIDESMIGFKGRTPYLRQYMPNKRHLRFGIKLWCLSDSSNGYLCQFEIYTDSQAKRPAVPPARSFTHELIIRLLTNADLLHRGQHLGVDNFFTSSKELTSARNGNLLCLAYQDNNRKPVLLSTMAKSGFIDTVNSRNQAVRRPAVIHAYNEAMGGVDLGDEKLYMYLAERQTLKWTNKVFFSLLGRAVLNSYILYKLNTTDKPVLFRYNFIISVLESLSSKFTPAKIIRRKWTREEISTTRKGVESLVPSASSHPLGGHDLV
ncbi:piggyBac transposable element-derived protein 4-like [Physella acuta]|uniref:piggyBac transposable element-derived protein 4-like n=1 Tax=Physella acuta TaxID=109671 RepID=UPI0027DBBAAA|nr:piggyBac transposable element-derived protein 4-like [Physella acuta]